MSGERYLETHLGIFFTEWFWAMAQFLLVGISFYYIYKQLRLQSKAHIITAIDIIYNHWSSEVMLRARHQVCQRWLDGENNFDSVAEYIAEYFEELGIYMQAKVLSRKEMWDVQSWNIEYYYSMFKEHIETLRIKLNDPTTYREFERLAHQMSIESKKQGAPSHLPKPLEDIKEHSLREVQRANTFLQLKGKTAIIKSK
jgi:hypothetical protein